MTRNPAFGRRPHRVEPRGRGWRARLEQFLQRVVEDGDRERDRHIDGCRRLAQQRKIAPQQRPLGEDRERRARLGQRRDDARHQLVAAFGALVRVGVGAEHDGVPHPGAAAKLLLEHVGDVDLDDDLRVEVAPRVEFEVLVRSPGEAVRTRMTASSVGVHRPVERHRRRPGHVVECALAHDLVEGDVGELGRRHRADQPVELLQAGKGRGIRHAQLLTLPTHGSMGTEIRM